jgi:hypothetical protein
MSNRDDGFPIADVSTVLLDDAKMRKLARLCSDDSALSSAIVVYMATLLGSWREGRRLTASEAESWIEPTDERTALLRSVDLFDAQNRVLNRAWERYFRPAWERRETARANGRKGAARRWGSDGDPIAPPSDGIAGASQVDSGSMPDKPTVLPSDLLTGSPSVLPSSSPSNGNKKNGSKEPDAEREARRLRNLQELDAAVGRQH